MNLKDIHLKVVDEREFAILRNLHGIKEKKDRSIGTVRITRPLVYQHHEELLISFLEHQYADKISFFNEGCNKIPVGLLRAGGKRQIGVVVGNVENDRERPGYIELYFKRPYANAYTRISFRRICEEVVGYTLVSSVDHYPWFSWENFHRLDDPAFFAVWGPDGIRNGRP